MSILNNALDEHKSKVTSLTRAPLRLAKSAWLQSSQETIFKVVSDHQELSELFPWMQSISLDQGTAEQIGGVGSQRCCNFGNGLVLEETIVAWEPPTMYAYSCQDETNPFGLIDHLGLVVCQPNVEDGAVLTWEQYFEHANPEVMQEKMNGTLAAAFQTLINRYGGKMLEIYNNFRK